VSGSLDFEACCSWIERSDTANPKSKGLLQAWRQCLTSVSEWWESDTRYSVPGTRC